MAHHELRNEEKISHRQTTSRSESSMLTRVVADLDVQCRLKPVRYRRWH
jgi:hypothetical protein